MEHGRLQIFIIYIL